MERIAVATSRTRDVATRFILNLTSLDRGAFDGDGGGATELVCRSMVTGVMLNLTAIADVVPIARYAPSWSIEKYVKVFMTVCACAFGAQWVLVKLVRLRRAQQGWWYYLRHSRHARLILPPECVTEAPMRSPFEQSDEKD